jgi:hypothetical protein
VVFSGATVPSTVLLLFPVQPPGASPDARFAIAPLSTGPVSLGPLLSDLVPGFLGSVSDMTALAGSIPRAVVVWQEIELEDPQTCGCSVPPPVRIDFLGQVVALGEPITAEGEPLLLYRWVTGDPTGPPITGPRVVATETPERFAVIWSDGILRFIHIDLTTLGVDNQAVSPPVLSLISHPNPFAGTTTIEYSVVHDDGLLQLTILDVRGRVVAQLADDVHARTPTVVRWDGRDSRGRSLPAGIYFARLESRGVVQSKKLVLVR